MVIDDTSSVIKLNQTDLIIGDLRLLTDKVSAQLFSYEGDDWKKLVTSQTLLVVKEKEPRSFYTADNVRKTTSKFVAETTVKLRIKPGTDESTKQKILDNPLNSFDKLILSVCSSHQLKSKKYITVKTIFKYCGGNRQPETKFAQNIEDSIDKLRFIEVKMDVSQAYANLQRLQKPNGKPIRPFKLKEAFNLGKYLDEMESRKPKKKDIPEIILSDYLLPAKTLTVEVNGIRTTAIQFYDSSPVVMYALDKEETTLLAHKLLSPKINNTHMVVCLKTYILMRIKAIKRSKNGGGKSLEPIITFKSIYENCGDTEKIKTDRKFRKRVRDTAFKYLTFLRTEKEILNFQSLDANNKSQLDLAKCVKFKIDWR